MIKKSAPMEMSLRFFYAVFFGRMQTLVSAE
jgi:hypothetical protein